MEDGIVLQHIGIVHNDIAEPDRSIVWEDLLSDVVLRDDLRPALEGLEEFSHIWVLFAFQPGRLGAPLAGPGSLTLHPMGRADLPEVGVLATRSPHRPTPIGMTAVPLLGREGATLRVRGLDAANGTPVLDVKPYLTNGDCLPAATAAPWALRLWSEAR